MRFTTEYDKREFLARTALKELKEIYPDLFKWDIHFTGDIYSVYDAYWFVMENDTISKRVFVELKIRDTDYDEYVFEWNKYKDIKKLIKDLYLEEGQYEILYINFTPSETLFWKVTDMDEKELIKKKMNKATSTSRSEKVDKSCWMLNKSSGKRMEYILNEKRLLGLYYDKYLVEKVKEVIKRKPGLEDILFN